MSDNGVAQIRSVHEAFQRQVKRVRSSRGETFVRTDFESENSDTVV